MDFKLRPARDHGLETADRLRSLAGQGPAADVKILTSCPSCLQGLMRQGWVAGAEDAIGRHVNAKLFLHPWGALSGGEVGAHRENQQINQGTQKSNLTRIIYLKWVDCPISEWNIAIHLTGPLCTICNIPKQTHP